MLAQEEISLHGSVCSLYLSLIFMLVLILTVTNCTCQLYYMIGLFEDSGSFDLYKVVITEKEHNIYGWLPSSSQTTVL